MLCLMFVRGIWGNNNNQRSHAMTVVGVGPPLWIMTYLASVADIVSIKCSQSNNNTDTASPVSTVSIWSVCSGRTAPPRCRWRRRCWGVRGLETSRRCRTWPGTAGRGRGCRPGLSVSPACCSSVSPSRTWRRTPSAGTARSPPGRRPPVCTTLRWCPEVVRSYNTFVVTSLSKDSTLTSQSPSS